MVLPTCFFLRIPAAFVSSGPQVVARCLPSSQQIATDRLVLAERLEPQIDRNMSGPGLSHDTSERGGGSERPSHSADQGDTRSSCTLKYCRLHAKNARNRE